jgi:phosphoribosylformylglycinamidine cyclo-ligase
VLSLIKQLPVHALAHITGGGIAGNLVRVLPEGCHAVVDESNWQWPALFTWMMETANIERAEMYRTFNCGVGMILVVPDEVHQQAIDLLNELGEHAFVIGEIKAGSATQAVTFI